MKILSLTMGSSYNLGDQAIQKVMLRFFSQMGEEVTSGKFYPFDLEAEREKRKPSKTIVRKKHSKVKKKLKKIKILRWMKTQYDDKRSRTHIRTQLDRYCKMDFEGQQFDLVLIGGGQLIKHAHDFIYCLQYWEDFFECPIYLIGVGCDDYFSRKEMKLYSKLLSRSKEVYVRDYFSLNCMREKFGINAQLIPDVAFLYNTLFDIRRNGEEDFQFVSIYDFETARDAFGYKDKDLYYEEWIKWIARSIDHNFPVAFGASTREDYLENEVFMNYYKEKFPRDQVQLYRTETVSELVNLLTKSRSVYSARMHILILAATAGVKNLVSFPISEKLKEFEKMYIEHKFDLPVIQKEIENKLNAIIEQEKIWRFKE